VLYLHAAGLQRPMSKFKIILAALLLLLVGIVIGGYLFDQSQPRSFLSLNRCQHCLSPEDLAGLLASVGIQKLSGLIPYVVFETDKTVVVKNPLSEAHVDYVIIPKKDIKDIGQISKEDAPYLIDAYLVAGYIIRKEKLSNYRLFTNGPGFQSLTYLHFHLMISK
jgi:Scavenger mRNA decapping enzyme C-term binding